MGQPVGTTADCKTVGFFLTFGFKRTLRASHALPSLALRLIVYGRKKTQGAKFFANKSSVLVKFSFFFLKNLFFSFLLD